MRQLAILLVAVFGVSMERVSAAPPFFEAQRDELLISGGRGPEEIRHGTVCKPVWELSGDAAGCAILSDIEVFFYGGFVPDSIIECDFLGWDKVGSGLGGEAPRSPAPNMLGD
jgi:hypothetical protein